MVWIKLCNNSKGIRKRSKKIEVRVHGYAISVSPFKSLMASR